MSLTARYTPVALAVWAILASGAAHAQAQSDSKPKAEDKLETVVVSASKKVQRMQEVPATVASLNAEMLENAKIDNVYNLTALVPALQITAVDPPGQGTGMALRGLGNAVFNMGFDPTVATFVDGISRSRSGLVAASDFLDVERVEVLMGPQGTLFGKNTTAGMVHMLSKKPIFEGMDGSASISYESYGTLRAKAAGNFVASPELAFRLAATAAKSDGWMTVEPTGQKIHNLDRKAVKGQVLWQPTATFSAHMIVDAAELDEVCCVPMRLVNDPAAVAINKGLATAVGSTIIENANLDALKVESNFPPEFKARDKGVSLELQWELSPAVTATSLTGYRTYSDSNVKDNDFSGVDILRSNDSLPAVDMWSQELRLSGVTADKSVDWITGVYFSKDVIERESDFIWGPQVVNLLPVPVPGTAFEHDFRQDIKSTAAFGSATWRMDKQWSLTTGLRYSRDAKTGSLVSKYPLPNNFGLPNSLPLPVVFDYDESITQSAPTGNISLKYQASRDFMVYGTLSRGYKSGGLSMTRDAAGQQLFFAGPTGCPADAVAMGPFLCMGTKKSATFDKETADHMEVGFKSDWMNRKLRLNGAVWDTHFKGLQMQTLRPDGSFAVVNAGGARSTGVEADLTAQVADGVTLTASLQYADARFDDGLPAITPGNPALGGQRLPFSSKWTSGLGLAWAKPIADGMRFVGAANVNYRSEYFNAGEPNPAHVQKGYSTVGVRAGVATDRWEAALWCRNCTDERITNSNFALPFDGAAFGASTRFTHVSEPRFVGVTVSYFFD